MKLYPWLRPHFKQLITAYQASRRYHALLIQALPGMGDDKLIYAVICFLMCQQRKGQNFCGNCRGCQLMRAGTHPDYYALKPEKGEAIIGIDTVREVSEKLYACAGLGGEKVVWINDVGVLMEAAAHVLLKILEEPPEKTWFFFSCREGALMARLRSRCMQHRLTVPQEKWAIAWLKKEIMVSENSAIAALRLCSGAPVAALELLTTNLWSQRINLCSALGNALKSYDWFSLLTVLNNEGATLRLWWVIAFLFDALKFQHGIKSIINVDSWPLVESLAQILTGEKLHVIIHELFQCHKKLLIITSLNRELVLADSLLFIESYFQTGSDLAACRN